MLSLLRSWCFIHLSCTFRFKNSAIWTTKWERLPAYWIQIPRNRLYFIFIGLMQFYKKRAASICCAAINMMLME